MALELVRDLIRIDQVMGEEMTQAMVEGDIVVPDSKPDVDKILSTDGWVVITDKEIVDNLLILEGVVNTKILYISREGDQPLYYMEGSFGFTQQIDLPGISGRMGAEAHVGIEHMDSALINSRKLNIKCILNLSGKAVDRSQMDVVKDVRGIRDIQVLKDYIEVNDTLGENDSHATARQEFQILAEKPSIKELLRTDVTVGERESRITEDRIDIQGVLNITTLYIGDDEANSINSVRYQLPFTQYIEIPGAMHGMRDRVRYSVEDFYSTVRENEEGQRRNIEYEIVVKAYGKVETTQRMEVLIDAYSPSVKLNITKSGMRLKKTLDRITEDMVVREEIELPGIHPRMSEICQVEASPVLTDYGISEGKMIIEGMMCIKALYISDSPEGMIHAYQEEIPFRHSSELPEGYSQAEMDVDIYLEDLQYRMLDSDLFEVRGRIRADIELNRCTEKEVMVDMEEVEGAEEYPGASIVVYVVQPGDNMWMVAKRYNTTIEELMKINEIGESDVLVPGSKLIISRTVKYQLS